MTDEYKPQYLGRVNRFEKRSERVRIIFIFLERGDEGKKRDTQSFPGKRVLGKAPRSTANTQTATCFGTHPFFPLTRSQRE